MNEPSSNPGVDDFASRTPEEVFADHLIRLGSGDLDAAAQNYSEDAVFVTLNGVLTGRDGVRTGLARLVDAVQSDAEWTQEKQFAGDVLLLRWTVESPTARVRDGVDTFVFRDGLIIAQTADFTLEILGA